jgi:hypothetical protein
MADEDQEAILVEAVDLVELDCQRPRPILPAPEGLAARLEAIHVGLRGSHRGYDTSGEEKEYDQGTPSTHALRSLLAFRTRRLTDVCQLPVSPDGRMKRSKSAAL